jgi:ABC-type spermidine/putrescine transport system permease subunit I
MTGLPRRARGARRGILAAVTVVLLLALGPFATPLVGDDGRGVASEALVDHGDDVSVIRSGRETSSSTSARLPSSRSLLVLALVAGVLLVAAPVRRRRSENLDLPRRPPLWSLPPHRGPPRLVAG